MDALNAEVEAADGENEFAALAYDFAADGIDLDLPFGDLDIAGDALGHLPVAGIHAAPVPLLAGIHAAPVPPNAGIHAAPVPLLAGNPVLGNYFAGNRFAVLFDINDDPSAAAPAPLRAAAIPVAADPLPLLAPAIPVDTAPVPDDDHKNPWRTVVSRRRMGREDGAPRVIPVVDPPAGAEYVCEIENPWHPKDGLLRNIMKHSQARKSGISSTPEGLGPYVYGSFGPSSLEY